MQLYDACFSFSAPASGVGASHPLGGWMDPLGLLVSAWCWQEKMLQQIENFLASEEVAQNKYILKYVNQERMNTDTTSCSVEAESWNSI